MAIEIVAAILVLLLAVASYLAGVLGLLGTFGAIHFSRCERCGRFGILAALESHRLCTFCSHEHLHPLAALHTARVPKVLKRRAGLP